MTKWKQFLRDGELRIAGSVPAEAGEIPMSYNKGIPNWVGDWTR